MPGAQQARKQNSVLGASLLPLSTWAGVVYSLWLGGVQPSLVLFFPAAAPPARASPGRVPKEPASSPPNTGRTRNSWAPPLFSRALFASHRGRAEGGPRDQPGLLLLSHTSVSRCRQPAPPVALHPGPATPRPAGGAEARAWLQSRDLGAEEVMTRRKASRAAAGPAAEAPSRRAGAGRGALPGL